jgi:hypothetical protein
MGTGAHYDIRDITNTSHYVTTRQTPPETPTPIRHNTISTTYTPIILFSFFVLYNTHITTRKTNQKPKNKRPKTQNKSRKNKRPASARKQRGKTRDTGTNNEHTREQQNKREVRQTRQREIKHHDKPKCHATNRTRMTNRSRKHHDKYYTNCPHCPPPRPTFPKRTEGILSREQTPPQCCTRPNSPSGGKYPACKNASKIDNSSNQSPQIHSQQQA